MKTITITLFVEPNSLLSLLTVLHILSGLDIENDYVFQPLDIIYRESEISNYTRINIPINEYLKFKHCYNKLKKSTS